jgi:energy-coupling factor transport system ATP-binding protein
VVLDASVRIRSGERIALVGPNGSGKSTLGRLLVGLLRPDRGWVRLEGADPARLPPAVLARQAGYVFQDPERQFLGGTVAEEVGLGLRPDERDRVDDLMTDLGLPLSVFGERSPYRLSGGEQRRLSLACVLVRRPDLLVLDEPTFGQDRNGHEALLSILRDRVDAGAAVLAATHDPRFIADFADRVIPMDAGRLVEIARREP